MIQEIIEEIAMLSCGTFVWSLPYQTSRLFSAWSSVPEVPEEPEVEIHYHHPRVLSLYYSPE
jgi:hypothetical protein